MDSESRAALRGGVTSVFEMPNTKPQTTTLEALEEKERIAKEKMHVNYAFFPGATNDNVEELRKLDARTIPGIKLFMGSSTGNMLVDKKESLDGIFALAREMKLPLMAHCEDTEIINRNMAAYKERLRTDDPDVKFHPLVRDEEACYKSSALGSELAMEHGAMFHIAHVTTEKELSLLNRTMPLGMMPEDGLPQVTGEATAAHLLFSVTDYATLGARIKCNPSVKSFLDQLALRRAVADGTISTIATDHAPHALEEKQGGCAKAMSGMPMVQFSLVSMLTALVDGMDVRDGEDGYECMPIERLVEVMCHNPARLFAVSERGFIKPGYKADLAIVRRCEQPWTVTTDCIESKCGWSPLEGMKMNWKVEKTVINGQCIDLKQPVEQWPMGEHIMFDPHED